MMLQTGTMRFCFELAILIWQTPQHHGEEGGRLNDGVFGRVRQPCKSVCWETGGGGKKRRGRGFARIQVPTIRGLTALVQWTT